MKSELLAGGLSAVTVLEMLVSNVNIIQPLVKSDGALTAVQLHRNPFLLALRIRKTCEVHQCCKHEIDLRCGVPLNPSVETNSPNWSEIKFIALFQNEEQSGWVMNDPYENPAFQYVEICCLW